MCPIYWVGSTVLSLDPSLLWDKVLKITSQKGRSQDASIPRVKDNRTKVESVSGIVPFKKVLFNVSSISCDMIVHYSIITILHFLVGQCSFLKNFIWLNKEHGRLYSPIIWYSSKQAGILFKTRYELCKLHRNFNVRLNISGNSVVRLALRFCIFCGIFIQDITYTGRKFVRTQTLTHMESTRGKFFFIL